MQILKDSMGKDLSHFCTPVYLNEPLSMLQRLTENFQYSDLLNRAAKEPNPHIRIALIAAFGLSAFSFNKYRTLKSFNPILGETFEYLDNDFEVRSICEQVSHHPPISACFAEGKGFKFYSNTHAETKIMIMKGCLEFVPIGRTYVNLTNFDEMYTYSKPRIGVKSLIFGKMHIDCYGELDVNNRKTGDTLQLILYEAGGKHKHGSLKGSVKNLLGEEVLRLDGNWTEQLEIAYTPKGQTQEVKEVIWRRFNDESSNDETKFFFTKYMSNLNHLSEELKPILPPTDSRFRTDQRALEEGNLELAASEKTRLEQKQREVRKEREKNGIKYEALYFKEIVDDITGESVYMNSNDYWKDRKDKNFKKSPDIFGK